MYQEIIERFVKAFPTLPDAISSMFDLEGFLDDPGLEHPGWEFLKPAILDYLPQIKGAGLKS